MADTPSDKELSEYCDRAYDRLLVLCGTRNGAPRWDDIATLLRERERLYLDLRLAAKPSAEPDPDAMNAKRIAEDAKLAANVREATIEELAKPADEGVLELLQRYGRHDDDCVAEPWHGKGPIRCSCGYSDALSTTGEPKR